VHKKNVNSAGYSLTFNLKIPSLPTEFAKVAETIESLGGTMSDISIIKTELTFTIRKITIHCSDSEHGNRIFDCLKNLNKAKVEEIRDDTLHCHLGGKIAITTTCPLNTIDDLARAYSPGVARICNVIKNQPSNVYKYTIKKNSVAVVSDGSAILGLGNLGPEAALPVMEGKAALFKKFANIDAYPICLATQETEEIIATVKNISPGFGGINLEDISSPRCFEIEERLARELDIPVFHDDQHGTAIVILAALINSLKIIKKNFESVKVVICGFGAAGIATAKLIGAYGVCNIIPCDRAGIIHRGRKEGMNDVKQRLLGYSYINPKDIRGNLEEALVEADIFIGLSGPNLISKEMVSLMAKDSIVFALSNPVPEIYPSEIQDIAKIIATGRSDLKNQVNNALCFPGLFRALLDQNIREVTDKIKIAAAEAIASCVPTRDLNTHFIVPKCFDKSIVANISKKINEVNS
jgi:malate dehydrogenase (oxaloacetate-decarboxylating)